MKKLLLLFIVISLSSKIKAQVVFCPPGAQWHYTFLWYMFWHTENAPINYVADTLISGETIKILSPSKFYVKQNCKYSSRTLIRQRGDTIYMNNSKTQNTWQTLYNFAATTGQSWQTTFLDAKNTSVTYTVSVDSVATVLINNFQLKRLYVKYWESAAGSFSTTITERFGCDGYMFNYYTRNCSSDADNFDKFLCYRDNEFGIKQFTDTVCNFTDRVGINEWSNAESGVSIYPNPLSDILNIELNGSNSKDLELTVSDLQGRELKRIIINEKDKIDLSNLSSGLYLISITRNKKIIYKEKLIKE